MGREPVCLKNKNDFAVSIPVFEWKALKNMIYMGHICLFTVKKQAFNFRL
ncbi:hypothetical protein B4096_2548 [Heyndrickxia coagulans]|nr:hypothetical protein B4100_2641 [Heyndrickxia coagulans]KYC92315.1 hypothetical protein B4096_2548 [Heyndrickxia coagulans]